MTAQKRILVVDDDAVIGRSFDRVLSAKGYAVIAARNGEEALRKIAEEKYDVVYTDIRMPGIDGIEVATRIKASQPWLPVVIVSGYATDENEARARAAGVRTVLHKPLSPDSIVESAFEAVRELAEAPAPADDAPRTSEPVAAPALPVVSPLKIVGLALAAPFVSLAYVIALPFFGLALLLGEAFRAALGTSGVARTLKIVGLAFAAPIVGLAYIVVGPFVGLGMILWVACGKGAKKPAGDA
jgi:CheY-like chemotaxis protein